MHISDGEWEVMRVIWEDEPKTAAEVIAALVDPTGWNHRTIRTMLGRLVEKGALDYDVDGARYLYRSAVSQDDCVRQRSESFLVKVFGGDASALVAHFVDDHDLSSEEIEELSRMLAAKKRQRPTKQSQRKKS
jgi:BlaI family penicillinase repressor